MTEVLGAVFAVGTAIVALGFVIVAFANGMKGVYGLLKDIIGDLK